MSRDQPGSMPYQVDYQNEASGKRLAATKRRIVWRFGFVNEQAMKEGHTGNNCRGVEHEVSVIWSLTSGKRQIAFDGREIHFSKSTEAKLETSWTMHGGHIVKVLAYAAPPLRAVPGFRQFDFLLDGMSFFDMTKIYELGTSTRSRGARGSANIAGRGGSSSHQHYSSPQRRHGQEPPRHHHQHHHNEDYDDQRSFASAPLPSVTPEKPLVAAAAPPTRAVSMPVVAVETVDLLELPMPSATVSQPQPQPHQTYQPAPMVAQPQQPQYHNTHYPSHQPGVGAPHASQYNGYHQPQIQQHQQQGQPVYYQQQQQQQPRVDEFAPVPPPPRTFQDVSNQILSNYGPDPNAPLALANAPHYDDHAYQNSSSSALIADSPHHVTPEKQQGPLTLRPTMAPVSIAELEAREHEQHCMSELERAMKSIVNLDDITETVETPEQAKQQRLKEANKPMGRSKPKPAVKPAWNLGLQPVLKDIKEHAPPKQQQPSREIMRTHAFDPAAAQAGMLVVYGAPSVAGPPPPYTAAGIPAVQGFGAGVQYAYHPQQQPPPPPRRPQHQHAMYVAH